MTINVIRNYENLLARCNDTFVFPSSLENGLDTVFYPPSAERKARVRARGANEQSPSGKLPSRLYDPTDTMRTDTRDHFFSSLLSLSVFFSTFSAKLFCGSWSTRLVNDSVTSWRCGTARCGVSSIFSASHFICFDNSRCYLMKQFDRAACIHQNMIECKYNFPYIYFSICKAHVNIHS